MANQFNNFDLLRQCETQGSQASTAQKKKKNKSKNKGLVKPDQDVDSLINLVQQSEISQPQNGIKNYSNQEQKLIAALEEEVLGVQSQQGILTLIQLYTQTSQEDKEGTYQNFQYGSFKRVLLCSRVLEIFFQKIMQIYCNSSIVSSLQTLFLTIFPPSYEHFTNDFFTTIHEQLSGSSQNKQSTFQKDILAILEKVVQDLRTSVGKEKDASSEQSGENRSEQQLQQIAIQKTDIKDQIQRVSKNKDKTVLTRLYKKLTELNYEEFEIQKKGQSGQSTYIPTQQLVQLLKNLKTQINQEIQASKSLQNGDLKQVGNSELSILDMQAQKIQKDIEDLEDQISQLRNKQQTIQQSRQQLLIRNDNSNSKNKKKENQMDDLSRSSKSELELLSHLENLLSKTQQQNVQSFGVQKNNKIEPLSEELINSTRQYVECCQLQYGVVLQDIQSQSRRYGDNKKMYELAQHFNTNSKENKKLVQEALSSMQQNKVQVENYHKQSVELVQEIEAVIQNYLDQKVALQMSNQFLIASQPILQALKQIKNDQEQLLSATQGVNGIGQNLNSSLSNKIMELDQIMVK